MPDRTINPPIKDAVNFDLTLRPYERSLLDNGVPVYAVNAGAEDVLMIELVFYAGNCYEEKNAVAAATNYLIKNGTTKKTAYQVNEHFEYYGAYLSRSCHSETATVTLHCLSKHLNVLLPVIRELITESIFPAEELETFKQNSKQRLAVNLKKCDFVAHRLIDRYLYGPDHPYGKFSNPEDYDALETTQLKEFFHSYYQNGRCVILAAGKLPDDFTKQVNTFFGDLDINKAITLPAYISKPSSEKKFRVNNDPGGVQAAIRIARPFPNRHHPDFKKVMVLNTLFGGFFGSRLMTNIREDKGYTYGIHSYLQNHIQQSAWVISTEVGKDVCEPAIKEIYNEMLLLGDKLVDDEELLLVKNYIMGSYLGDLDGPFKIIARWKNLILNDLGADYFYESIKVIKEITAEELRELARKYFVPGEFFELAVI